MLEKYWVFEGSCLMWLGRSHGNQNGATNYTVRKEILYTNYEAAYCSRNDKSNNYLKIVTYKFTKIDSYLFLCLISYFL